MFELIRNILFVAGGIFIFYYFMSDMWQELAERYKTEHSLPKTFLITDNQRISFREENKSRGTAFTQLGIGLCDSGLYLSQPNFFDPLSRFPALLIPWSDIAYRKVASNKSLNGYYTFYIGNPRIVRFSLNGDTINKLEQDYGESIFSNKLGEPE
ncbi:MAG: hypothetical protein AAFQ80_05165 [Cyanobacteria bacterium J06621_8]